MYEPCGVAFKFDIHLQKHTETALNKMLLNIRLLANELHLANLSKFVAVIKVSRTKQMPYQALRTDKLSPRLEPFLSLISDPLFAVSWHQGEDFIFVFISLQFICTTS